MGVLNSRTRPLLGLIVKVRVCCWFQGPDGYPRKVKVVDNGDGTFKASYTPDDCGRYKINIKYGGKEVPNCPISVQAYATGNVSQLLLPYLGSR